MYHCDMYNAYKRVHTGGTAKSTQPTGGRSRPIAAAIDFGTTYSGYAFSMNGDVTRVHCNQSWVAGSRALVSLKTPTCILLNGDKTFNSFGYEAENKIAELAEDRMKTDMHFFYRFKMALYNNKTLSKKTLIKDVRGESMPAITIFAMALRYMKDHLMTNLNRKYNDIKQDDIQFVVTVPAIWNDTAKLFMRAAALDAGIEGDQLSLALESEAASVWCQHVPVSLIREEGHVSIDNLSVNSKYMVVDLGGGTADITVHQLIGNKQLREIHKASGGDWGGIQVDNQFLKLIISLVTPNVFQIFKQNEVMDFLDLLREFETKKRTITSSTKGKVTLKVPMSLKKVYERETKRKLEDAVQSSYLADRVEWVRDKVRIEASLVKDCFEFVIKETVQHIEALLKEPDMADVKTMLMAGGFSDCHLVQERFMGMFGQRMDVLVPDEACILVLKGAVLCGHSPNAISSRISHHTYGLAVTTDFDPEQHPPEKMREVNGRSICIDVFWKAVEVGETLPVGHKVTRIGKPAVANQTEIQHDIYKANTASPQFVTDPGCEKIGSIKCPLPDGKTVEEKQVEEILFFGPTDLKYIVRHPKTGDEHGYFISSL